jgi:hypothetical protein
LVLDSNIVPATIAEIEAAFSGLTPPGDERLLHPQCMDDGDVVDFYGAVDRRQLTDDTIISNYAAPSFFSAEAFQYYMPAFMIWSLNHHDTIEYAPESTIRAFDPTNENPRLYEFQISKFALFTKPQRAAVIRFLQAFSTDPDLGPIAKDALANYWLRPDSVSV